MSHYLTYTRLQLRQFDDQADFSITVTDEWHFQDAVYNRQAKGDQSVSLDPVDQSVIRYNELLSQSTFALCPSGSGPNSIRLWEALAVGCIPVLLGELPAMPAGGSLPHIPWDEVVLRIAPDDLTNLPALLRSITPQEVAQRQALGTVAYTMVRAQRCFTT
jgi:hypothetical protein